MAALASASLVESVQFNQTIVLPNAVQGLFRRRPAAVAVATRMNVDGLAVGLMERIRRNHGPGPVWVRVMSDRALVVLAPEDVRRVLEGSPHPFASDPPAKRKGMSVFQPDALTLSRGELWEDRRRFAESVLDSAERAHRLADRFVAVTREELGMLVEDLDRAAGGELGYDSFYAAFRRIVRRVVLGDAARDDEELSALLGDLMSEGNKLPSGPSEHYEPYIERLSAYVDAAAPGSLVGLVAEAPSTPDTKVVGQITHWLFALQDTLAANALRALAAIVTHPQRPDPVDDEYLRAALNETMRLWPTTPLLSRETLVELSWNAGVVPAGTQVLIVNTFHHRDRERIDYADRFAPEEWITGDAASDWTFNHFSHGPQGCPGANLALLIGTTALGELLARRRPRLVSTKLDHTRPLPHMLDVFKLRFAMEDHQ